MGCSARTSVAVGSGRRGRESPSLAVGAPAGRAPPPCSARAWRASRLHAFPVQGRGRALGRGAGAGGGGGGGGGARPGCAARVVRRLGRGQEPFDLVHLRGPAGSFMRGRSSEREGVGARRAGAAAGRADVGAAEARLSSEPGAPASRRPASTARAGTAGPPLTWRGWAWGVASGRRAEGAGGRGRLAAHPPRRAGPRMGSRTGAPEILQHEHQIKRRLVLAVVCAGRRAQRRDGARDAGGSPGSAAAAARGTRHGRHGRDSRRSLRSTRYLDTNVTRQHSSRFFFH